MASKMTTRDILEMKCLDHSRVHYFRRMRGLLKIFAGSKIEISSKRKSNHIWPVYNLIDKDGRIIASLSSVVNGMGLVNTFYLEDVHQ